MANNAEILPPNATPRMRALDAAVADRMGAVPADIAAVRSIQSCPIGWLPWLAWELSVDQWDADWSDAEKRAAVASAIADHRIKGTRAAVARALARRDAAATIAEWWEMVPRGTPATFSVTIPAIDAAGAIGGTRMSAATARAIYDDIMRVKPLRAHFELLQRLDIRARPAPVAAAKTVGAARIRACIDLWSGVLQDADGSPLTDDFDNMIDMRAADA